MPFSSAPGKGKGSWAKKRKRRQSNNTERAGNEPQKTETSPHILAALEAQRARASQQQLEASQQTGEAPAQPPSKAASTYSPSPKPATTSPPKTLPGFVFDLTRDRFFRLVGNPIGTSGRSRATKDAKGVAARAARSAAADAAAAATAAAAVAAGSEGCRRSRKGRGLHSYAMNLRRGSWGVGLGGKVVGGLPAAPERLRRAAVESVVSSSRFRIEEVDSWARGAGAPGTSYSAIDCDARRGVMAVGTVSGDFGMSWARTRGCNDGDRLVHGRRRGRRNEEHACWWSREHVARGQIADVKFRSHVGGWACATASSGYVGEPGGVSVRYWGNEEEGGARTMEGLSGDANVCGAKLQHGSMWCVEWDPLTPSRLAIGPSSCSPVSIFDLEHQRLTAVAQLASDVFSISFLPLSAPGAGGAMVGGLRDGSVVLLDPRQPSRQNVSSIVSRGGRGDNVKGGRGRGRIGRSSSSTTTATSRTLANVYCSIDHAHILQDGTRCLVKDRSGGLQTLDLRFAGRPLKVLVPPTAGTRAPVPGKFALDPGETVVATPIAAAPEAAGVGMVGGGERFLSAPRAWDAFSGSGSAAVDHRGGVSRSSSGGGGRNDATSCKGDRLRLLSVSSGEVLNDIATPWTGMSLAPGISGRGAEGAGCHGDVHFWGIARRDPSVVFEARLRARECEGFGREQ